jgi:nucleotide-binding universal stress UspA family protein
MLHEQIKARANGTPEAPARVTSALQGAILVHVPTEGEPESLKLALGLAEASSAAVIAVISEGFEAAAYAGRDFTTGSLMQALLDAQRRRIAAAAARAEAMKKTARASVAVHVEEQFPEDALNAFACGADWVVVARPDPGASHAVYADPSAVVLRTGLPVLLAPLAAGPLTARRIIVGWRDSREARRALSDAMPLLKAAQEVLVVSVSQEDRVDLDRTTLEQVTARLNRLGCKARCELHQNDGRQSVAALLEEWATSIEADLIVTGAYAHSRAGEWVFGGVTRTLIESCSRYLLMSH